MVGRIPRPPDICLLLTSDKVATDPKITARRYDSDTGSVSYIVYVFPIRYSIKAAQQDSAFKMTYIEAKSINCWLRYDPKWNMCGN